MLNFFKNKTKSPKVTLLGCDAGSTSAHKLEKTLKNLGVDLFYTDRYEGNNREKDTDILIRWGNYGGFPLNPGAIELSSAKSIRSGCNKLKSRRILQENGVSVPKSYFSRQEALKANPKFPLIGRPESHMQGKNIEFIKNTHELENSHSSYYSE